MNVRWFRKDEIGQLQEAIDAIWAPNHVLVHDTKLLNHMFLDNPVSKQVIGSDNFSFVGLWEAEKIVGILGAIPYKLNVKGTDKLGFALTNWKVDKNYSGMGLMLLKYVQEYSPDMILSLGINRNIAKLYQVMQWDVTEDVSRWIGIKNINQVRNAFFFNNEENLLHNFRNIRLTELSNNSLYLVDFIDETWDEFYVNCFAKVATGFTRNYEFLKWRYINHPSFKYHFIAAKNERGQYTGLVIFRLEKVLNNQHVIGRIVEFMAVDNETSNLLANAIVDFNENILFWDFYCMSGISTWGLENIGFKRTPKWLKNQVIVPTRFQPLDLKCISMGAAVYLSPQLKNDLSFIDDMQWYITKGDSDQDRPN